MAAVGCSTAVSATPPTLIASLIWFHCSPADWRTPSASNARTRMTTPASIALAGVFSSVEVLVPVFFDARAHRRVWHAATKLREIFLEMRHPGHAWNGRRDGRMRHD